MNSRRVRTAATYLFICMILLMGLGSALPPVLAAPLQVAEDISFSGEELLGRPTDSSITINVIPDENIELYYKYGIIQNVYPDQTLTTSATSGQPVEVIISGLQSNTKYYYRMVYRTSGGDWVERAEHSFFTQRSLSSEFTFDITSDSHVNILLGSSNVWQQTLENVADDQPDFLLDLGDTFAMDNVTTVQGAEQAYLFQRPFFEIVGHSASIFLATGNHEQEEGWHLDDTGNPATSQPVIGTNARKKYFVNPVPDTFYSGNLDTFADLSGDHLHEDYYAWEWGDALFVVIDPFWYTTTKPFTGNIGGGEGTDTGSGDRWDWTLGQTQFNWFKQVVEDSDARYKFVFAHHMVGGSQDYVREGATPAHLFEWGGNNIDGVTWGFDTERPGWGSEPVHQLMIANGVSAFFHGHDHQYAYEKRDGIVYQAMPSSGFTGNGFNLYSESDPYTIKVLPSAGHLRVTVNADEATVDYVRSDTTGGINGDVSYSYIIEPNTTAPTHDLTMAVNPAGGGTTTPSVGEHAYLEDSVVDISATPAAGYTFVSWTGDVADPNAASTTVTMDADQTVTANFALITHDLTMAVSPAGGGTTTPAVGAHTYNEGMVVNVSAAPAAGYVFVSWTGDVADPNAANTTVTVDADKTVTANFTLITHGLTMAVSPAGGGTTTPAVGAHTYNEGAVVNISAAPAAGYTFVSWTGDVADPNAASTTVTMDADKTVTANFTTITHDLTIAVNPAGGGTTLPTFGLHTYAENAVVNISATPEAGYAFVSWTGDVADPNAASTTVTMDADKTVTANFVDDLPPETTITQHPEDPSLSTLASFSFTSNEPGSTFECRLDGGLFSPCTSPQTYTALAYGEHIFEVRAIDPASNPDATPASYTWTIQRALYLPLIMNE